MTSPSRTRWPTTTPRKPRWPTLRTASVTASTLWIARRGRWTWAARLTSCITSRTRRLSGYRRSAGCGIGWLVGARIDGLLMIQFDPSRLAPHYPADSGFQPLRHAVGDVSAHQDMPVGW